MILKILPLLIGFILDLLIGDPHEIPHPVVWIGRLISFLEKHLRRIFPKSFSGEKAAGAVLWIITISLSAMIPALILYLSAKVSPIFRIAVESIMCWQILAIRDLRDESMKVYQNLIRKDLPASRKAVSMIVGRDTDRLDEKGITRAAVETIAENTADGIAAPLLFLAIGGAPAGFFYKAVNTMDSMLGYIDPPYTNFGMIPAKADDICGFIPSRFAAVIFLFTGFLMKMDAANGIRIFLRDRYKHASPNSAQTESACAGLLRIQLAGDAYYHGILHKKPFIGDPLREIETEDIPRTCHLMYAASFLMLLISCLMRLMLTGF